MAYNKLYTKTTWNNDNRPAINADNLNHIEKGIDDIDSRVVEIGNDVIDVKSGLLDYQNNGYLPKNLLDTSNISNLYVTSGNTFTTNNDSVAVIIKNPKKTVTISGDFSIVNSNTVRIGFTNTPSANGSYVRANASATEKTVEANTTNEYMVLMFYNSPKPTLEKIKLFQVEIGSSASDYVPYFPPISTINTSLHDIEFLGWEVPSECPIQNSFDGKTFTQRVSRKNLSELSWNVAQNGKSKNMFYANVSDISKDDNIVVYSKTLTPSRFVTIWNAESGNYVSNNTSVNRIYLYIDSLKSGSVADLTNYLKTHDDCVYYELATPITYNVGSEAVSSINESLQNYKETGYIVDELFSDRIIQIGKNWILQTASDRAIANVLVEPSTKYTFEWGSMNGISQLAFMQKVSADSTSNVGVEYKSEAGKYTLTTGATTKCICVQFAKSNISLADIQGMKIHCQKGDDIVLSNRELSQLKADLVYVSYPNAGSHNAIYRGKFLGDSVTTEQWDEIKNGTFRDLYIGDYWTISGVNWRIAAFDYWLRTGDTECTKHHVLIVPDTSLYNAKMNDTNITTGAYIGSKMYTDNLAQAKTTINNAFGSSHILSHREYLPNATKATADPTYESAGSWYDSTVELMNERMVYGADVFHNIEVNGAIPTNYTIDKSQLPLFALEPSRICNRASWWLRDVVSAACFAFVAFNGSANDTGASESFGVRPAFGITAD